MTTKISSPENPRVSNTTQPTLTNTSESLSQGSSYLNEDLIFGPTPNSSTATNEPEAKETGQELLYTSNIRDKLKNLYKESEPNFELGTEVSKNHQQIGPKEEEEELREEKHRELQIKDKRGQAEGDKNGQNEEEEDERIEDDQANGDPDREQEEER